VARTAFAFHTTAFEYKNQYIYLALAGWQSVSYLADCKHNISPLRNANVTFMYRGNVTAPVRGVQLAPLSNISSGEEKMHLSVCISHLFPASSAAVQILPS
jgi:hypothetical protein